MSEIIIYKSPDNQTQIEVKLENNTVWLDAHLIAVLFNVNRPAIVKHINNIYLSQELNEESTCSILEQVAADGKRRKMNLYNLDMIISVGYRVNSKQATQFRQWATQRLKDYLVQGYTINEKLLKQSREKYNELKGAIDLIARAAGSKKLEATEGEGILKILHEYSHALDLLDKYDHQALQIPTKGQKTIKKLSYNVAIKQVQVWRDSQKAGNLFGNEKDASFKSSINTIYQTFDGKELYPTLEEKAAPFIFYREKPFVQRWE